MRSPARSLHFMWGIGVARVARSLDELPAVYREQAVFPTDHYEVYKVRIPAEQHRAMTKKARKTNHIERFNNTLRQRVSPPVACDTFSSSKNSRQSHWCYLTFYLLL